MSAFPVECPASHTCLGCCCRHSHNGDGAGGGSARLLGRRMQDCCGLVCTGSNNYGVCRASLQRCHCPCGMANRPSLSKQKAVPRVPRDGCEGCVKKSCCSTTTAEINPVMLSCYSHTSFGALGTAPTPNLRVTRAALAERAWALLCFSNVLLGQARREEKESKASPWLADYSLSY
jgi:hypothetical protein